LISADILSELDAKLNLENQVRLGYENNLAKLLRLKNKQPLIKVFKITRKRKAKESSTELCSLIGKT